MLAQFLRLPLIVALMVTGALAMLVPSIMSAVMRDWELARAFLHYSLLFLVVAVMIGLAVANRADKRPARAPLVDLVTAFTVLPAMLAVPIWVSMPDLSFLDAYFEMVSCLTTTGATLLAERADVPDAIHLWRALVGWMGGYLIWVMAIAILAPMSLGGFEVTGRTPEVYSSSSRQIAKTASMRARFQYYNRILMPVYAVLTLVIWVALYLMGETSLVAISHAMATMSTSGISPIGGTSDGNAGFAGELLVAVFLLFALSRQTFTRDGVIKGPERLLEDRELRTGLMIVLVVPLLLFLRHWVGAITEDEGSSVIQAAQALWGGVFTVLSFLTTAGFESAHWEAAQKWSGISTPGLIFVGLALVGGGVATTAGGVKLLRVHVLYRYSQRELERLVHPSAVGRTIGEGGADWRQGAFIAWIFFMLFAISFAVVMLGLSLAGLNFEGALLLAAAGLSTTGPLAPMITGEPTVFAQLSEGAKIIFALTMVLGRVETLAFISLLNPEFWRA